MRAIRVAIPAMDELDYLPVTLDALSCQQTTLLFEVYVCVNQPDTYWDNPAKFVICEHNRQLLEYLRCYDSLTLHVLDYASPGKGWKGKQFGVGFARKVLFDNILSDSEPDDLVVSLDADTKVGPGYLQSLADNFAAHPDMQAVAVPYYHDLNPADEEQSRAMLRYEIYMRNYAINLLKINSPYGFTALGSAIVMRAGALRKVGNITPFQSGEDFYLVQKFCKMGGLRLFNSECVYPAGRYSDRVPFGTGPAMLKGKRNDWSSYPIYPYTCFQPMSEAYSHLEELYKGEYSAKDNDFLFFLQKDLQKKDIWSDIRRNVADFAHFVKAFHQKADGLRILQYVRAKNIQNTENESDILISNMQRWLPDEVPSWLIAGNSLTSFPARLLNEVRDSLFRLEQVLRKQHHEFIHQ